VTLQAFKESSTKVTSSMMLCCVVWEKFPSFSEVLTSTIITAMMMMMITHFPDNGSSKHL
jgi:hypothetical protein